MQLLQAQMLNPTGQLHDSSKPAWLSSSGAKVAVCEMPFDLVASDKKGGAGGTCVLRGCVPKKLMVYGGEFAQAFKDSQGFG